MDNIKDKKILFIAIPFFNYEIKIKKELENLGAKVDYFPVKPLLKSDFPLFQVVFFLLNLFYKNKYTNAVINFVTRQNKVYDHLFVVPQFPASKKLIVHLKRINPHLKSFIFFWDSFDFYNFSHQIKWFDYAYSFDRGDCNKHKGLQHIHNFYIDSPVEKTERTIYDFSYIGSVYVFSNYKIDTANKLIEDAKRQGISYFVRMKYFTFSNRHKGLLFRIMKKSYLIFFIKQGNIFRKKVKKYLPKAFLFPNSISLEDTTKIQNESKAIVDISYRNRIGLTFNVIAAVAYNKKLITTNRYIADESFYHPNNVLIIDEHDPHVDKKFLNSPVVPMDISYLKLDNWLKTIFNRENE